MPCDCSPSPFDVRSHYNISYIEIVFVLTGEEMNTNQVSNELLYIGRNANAVNSIKTLAVAAHCVKPARNPHFSNVSFNC
jgi:hypothetical protein